MPLRFVPAIVAVVAVAVVWLGFTLWEAASRRRVRALASMFSRYAAERHMELVTFAELTGVVSDQGPPLLHGEVQGVPIDVSVESPSTRPSTRVTGTLPGVLPGFVMRIEPRASARRAAGLLEAPTGNKAFDAAYALLSNEPDLARSLLDRRLAQVVLGFPRAFVELGALGQRFALSWRGLETDEEVLDAAVEVVFTACRRRA
jgi:hypothetical protein